MTQHFKQIKLNNDIWVVVEEGHDYLNPTNTYTFTIDTENIVLFDGQVLTQEALAEKLKDLDTETKRARLTSIVWAWQCYDEINGFFMTNDFDTWLTYQCRAHYKYGWCYNAKFDFSQIDYKILTDSKWKPYERGQGKNQSYAYESLHSDMGARYSYKLWYPYKQGTKHNQDSHTYVHSVEFRDFMLLVPSGLAKLLNDFAVTDNEGNAIRKLTMDYQAVNTDELTQEQMAYCCNDVKGLYFAVKKFNEAIEQQSNGECHIYGKDTNIMTAGGFAKSELLRSLYPNLKNKKLRLKRYQAKHPLTAEQDKWLRDNHLYRGGISYVNPRYKGKLLTKNKNGIMYRYDVNSEYPYAMANIYDLVGKPQVINYDTWLGFTAQEKQAYECILMLTSVSGHVKKGYIGFWYNPFRHDFVDVIDENELHLMYEFEFDEMLNYYDIDFTCEKVLLIKRGEKVYAPFVNDSYAIKAQAKKEGNAALQAATKLKLNSSYGKLAERLIRRKGHYELNKENGCVHYVNDGDEIDTTASMSLLVGALVTAYARVYILSKIREVCKESKMTKNFVYIDTDSIHTFNKYDKADAFTLGGLKLEAECEAVKYILPKTYIDIERVTSKGRIGYYIDKKTKKRIYQYEAHSKGINIAAVKRGFESKLLTLDYINKKFDYGTKYIVLCAMNVKGGKVLVPTYKYLARPEQQQTITTLNKGYDGGFYSEI